MAKKILYQTLEERFTDLDKLESDGPYPCHWKNSWLGDGYYFWDTFIDNAHWWGKEVRNYKNGYLICRAECDFNDVVCCDLVGNTEHLLLFREAYFELRNRGLADSSTTVRRLIEFLKGSANTFSFEAIRATGIKSRNDYSTYNINVLFESSKKSYLDLSPAIQICLYCKNAMNLRNFRVVFPEEYCNDYLV